MLVEPVEEPAQRSVELLVVERDDRLVAAVIRGELRGGAWLSKPAIGKRELPEQMADDASHDAFGRPARPPADRGHALLRIRQQIPQRRSLPVDARDRDLIVGVGGSNEKVRDAVSLGTHPVSRGLAREADRQPGLGLPCRAAARDHRGQLSHDRRHPDSRGPELPAVSDAWPTRPAGAFASFCVVPCSCMMLLYAQQTRT